MPDPADHHPPYEVHASGAIARVLRQIQRKAARERRGKKVLATIRHIHERLRQNPYEVGEPLYRLPSLRMQVRTCVLLPLVVDFAISEDKPLVFIKGVKLLPR